MAANLSVTAVFKVSVSRSSTWPAWYASAVGTVTFLVLKSRNNRTAALHRSGKHKQFLSSTQTVGVHLNTSISFHKSLSSLAYTYSGQSWG
jgi:hypothetical protein